MKNPEWKSTVVVRQYESPKIWRILLADQDGKVTNEEAIFTVYGAIADIDLPPFKIGGSIK